MKTITFPDGHTIDYLDFGELPAIIVAGVPVFDRLPDFEPFVERLCSPKPSDPWAHFKGTMQRFDRKNKRDRYRKGKR